MTTKHTCNEGHGPAFGRRQAYGTGCARCDELTLGAKPVVWSDTAKRHQQAALIRDIRSHDCKVRRCGPICTAFDY
jgi:hypothetical protein